MRSPRRPEVDGGRPRWRPGKVVEIAAVILVGFVLHFWDFGFRQIAPGRVSVCASGARRLGLQSSASSSRIGPLKSLRFRRTALFCRFAASSRLVRADAVGSLEVGRRIGPLKSLRFRRMALFWGIIPLT